MVKQQLKAHQDQTLITQVVLITHRFEEIMSNISHVLLLKNGRVYQRGRRAEILTKENLAGLYRSENSLPAGPDNLSALSGTRGWNTSDFSAGDGKTAGNVLIKMIDTTVKFKDVTVLDKVNWTVKQAENWMILGPNGSGKTTLLKLVLGENQQAYANDIYLFGRKKGSGESVWEIKQNIGFISSELQARYPSHLSAFDVVCSGFFDSIGLYRLCGDRQKNTARSTAYCERTLCAAEQLVLSASQEVSAITSPISTACEVHRAKVERIPSQWPACAWKNRDADHEREHSTKAYRTCLTHH